MRKSHLIRLLVLAPAALCAVVALGLPATARATNYTLDGGTGTCYTKLDGRTNITAPDLTYTNQFDVAIVVKEWVRLVDLNANPISDWFAAGTAAIAPRSSVSFSAYTLQTSLTLMRIQRHLEAYWNSSLPFDVTDSFTASYKKFLDFNMGGMFGIVKASAGTGSYC